MKKKDHESGSSINKITNKRDIARAGAGVLIKKRVGKRKSTKTDVQVLVKVGCLKGKDKEKEEKLKPPRRPLNPKKVKENAGIKQEGAPADYRSMEDGAAQPQGKGSRQPILTYIMYHPPAY